MKPAVVLAFLSLTFSASVDAVPRDTNAWRLVRGLPPLKPVRRETGAKRSRTSSTPFHCASSQTFCCSNYESSSSAAATDLLSDLGIGSSSCGEKIGTGCVAMSGDSCSSGTAAKCCGNIVGSALVGIDCTPVTVSSSSAHPASSLAYSTEVSSSAPSSRASTSS
ncbi:hypothetical protein DFH07DRAFT_769902 [Mycena maculata]|uniref:Hydrophobin n=1 Tax=Mycena maculata TaxID=230809 RepID=A0AAD7JN23_9AGAR|nr:hypothetical protein DFH07DRAFT_769902 [Mycena maculata]